MERVGVDAARDAVAALMPGSPVLRRAVPVTHTDTWTRRDVLGVHDQAQAGKRWVGACIPVGRLFAADFDALAGVADAHGDGTVRFTVDENVVFPNVAADRVDAMLADPLFTRFPVPVDGALSLTTALVSCTGAQFCGLALAETKLPLLDAVRALDRELVLTRPVRIHVTGCPNSCGQAQAGDIGLIGAPAKKEVDGKKVAVHAHGADGIRLALAAGADSIEHGTMLGEEEIRLFLKSKAYYVPTLSTVNGYIERLAANPDAYSPEVKAKIEWRIGVTGKSLQAAFPRGVKIAFGTDAGVSKHGRNADEFELMVKNGMPAAEAIVAATVNAAELLGLGAEIGSLEPGKRADLIAVEGDPLEDVTVLKKMAWVMKDGRQIGL